MKDDQILKRIYEVFHDVLLSSKTSADVTPVEL